VSVSGVTDTKDSILPILAFSLDMLAKTAMSFRVNEVLLPQSLAPLSLQPSLLNPWSY